jgi:5-hydroxyisourate hydrolase
MHATFPFFLKELFDPSLCIQAMTPVIKASGERRPDMSGYLTTHVLDTARGCPAEGLKIELFRIDGDRRLPIRSLVTNDDGRTNEHILPAGEFEPGAYELVFHVGDYLDAIGTPPEDPRFLDIVPLRFGMSEAAHYHVPLLLSPFGYSTYRGS